MSAFACEPGRGSEQEVGWRWALEMARWYDVTVLTQTRNRPGIERELARGLPDDRTLWFEYFQLPEPIYRLKSRFDPLTWPYYVGWQWALRRVAARLHAREPFVLAHHVTFVSFRAPVWLKGLGIPVVFGPVGGAEKAPSNLLKQGFGALIWGKEKLRNAATDLGARVLRLLPPLAPNGGICLAATPGMAAIFTRAGLPNEVFPAIGMDVEASVDEQAGEPTKVIRFLWVGRFHPLKGVHLLLKAFARAALPNATLTLIGSGPDESRLKALAADLGLADRLVWTGKLPRAELPAHYRQHQVFIAPSLYESGGLTVLEAMSEGLPAIVLDVGGHSVSVTEECGTKVPPTGSVDDVIGNLCGALQRYAAEPGLIPRQGNAAKERVAREYAWLPKARRMRSIYERLLA
jgi:glycosyltransferase involved in cell wall biosynthesis